jgi:beta-lactamase class A
MGLNHPIDAKFGPDDCLYVVDFGVFEVNGQVPNAVQGTGVVWKICKQRTEFGTYAAAADKSLSGDGKPWEPDYAALQKQLTGFVGDLGNEWGIFFKDLHSGKTFGVNQGVRIPAASTVKVPVVLYASTLAQQGTLNMNERMDYVADRDWRGGAGSLQYTAKDGDTFTIRELCEKAIRESDNVAWHMLERRLGKDNIAAFMTSQGGKVVYPWGENVSTPEDLATYMQAALNYAKESTFGDKLMYDLAHTIWNTGLNRYITEVQVAHKEGDVTGVADDVGVVYANHPYILSIMSQGHDDVELGFEQIGQISRMVYDYQAGLEAPKAP